MNNITNYVCIHDEMCIRGHKNYSDVLNNEFNNNVIYIYNKQVKNTDTWINNNNIIHSNNNEYFKYNKHIGRYSGLLYLLKNPHITKTDYITYVSCGWFISKLPQFELREDSITTAIWTVPNNNIVDEIVTYNGNIKKQLSDYIEICNDEHFYNYCYNCNVTKMPFEVIPKKQFSKLLNIIDNKILPNIDTYIQKYPDNTSITEILHMFFIHYNYYIITNFRIVNGLNVLKRVINPELHNNNP